MKLAFALLSLINAQQNQTADLIEFDKWSKPKVNFTKVPETPFQPLFRSTKLSLRMMPKKRLFYQIQIPRTKTESLVKRPFSTGITAMKVKNPTCRKMLETLSVREITVLPFVSR